MGSITDSTTSSIVEEELTELNRKCLETSGSMACLRCNTTSVSFEYSPVGTLREFQDIFVSNRNENELGEEKVTTVGYVVESTEPYKNCTRILAPELTPLSGENKIISSVSIGLVQEHVKNLDISKENKSLPSPNKIESAMKQIDALEEQTMKDSVHDDRPDALEFQFVKPLLPFSQTEGNQGFQTIPMASAIHPQAFYPDPLESELIRMITKMQEQKIMQLKLECDQELEKVHKKYVALLQKVESEYNQGKEFLDTMYSKVLINRILAEKLRSCYIDTQGCCSTGPTPPTVSEPVLDFSEPTATFACNVVGLSANLKRKRF